MTLSKALAHRTVDKIPSVRIMDYAKSITLVANQFPRCSHACGRVNGTLSVLILSLSIDPFVPSPTSVSKSSQIMNSLRQYHAPFDSACGVIFVFLYYDLRYLIARTRQYREAFRSNHDHSTVAHCLQRGE